MEKTKHEVLSRALDDESALEKVATAVSMGIAQRIRLNRILGNTGSNEEIEMGRDRTSKHPPKTLVGLQRAEVFLATYVDGQQYSDSRLVVKIGDHLHYLHPEIGGGQGADATLKPPAGWLKEQIMDRLAIDGVDGTDTEIPDDEVSLSREVVG